MLEGWRVTLIKGLIGNRLDIYLGEMEQGLSTHSTYWSGSWGFAVGDDI